jgi:hypothetical protein
MNTRRALVLLCLASAWGGAAVGVVACSASSSGGSPASGNDAEATGDGTVSDTSAGLYGEGGEAASDGGLALIQCTAPEVPCYQATGAMSCAEPAACTGFALGCTSPTSCGSGQVCCAEFADGGDPFKLLEAGTWDGNAAGFDASAYQIRMLVCQTSCGDGFQLCNQSGECQNGGTCASAGGAAMGKVCTVLPDSGPSLEAGGDGG